MPASVKYRVCFTVELEGVLRLRVSKTPNANALESIVPMNAAIRDTTRNDPSRWGNAFNTPSMNKFVGSRVIPENLKLTPRYAIAPATRKRRIKEKVNPLLRDSESLVANTL